jgi:RNA polymerase sigma-70 factor, ECF subfamily
MAGVSFADEVLTYLPKLAAYAARLAGRRCVADDLVQDTVLRALLHADQFKPGSNLGGWLTAILRNCYFNEWRNYHRIQYGALHDESLVVDRPQERRASLDEVQRELAKLPAGQQEAIVLIVLNGESYEHAATMAKCPVGTMKSRVSRARSRLGHQLAPVSGT